MKTIVKEKLFTRNYIILILTAFIGGFLMTLYTSTMPLYVERLTGTAMYAGLVTTIFTIAALVSRPITGIICEKHRHVPILIVGFIVMTLACLGYGVSTSLLCIFAMRVFHGIGFGIKTTVSGVLIAENVPQSRFTEGIGIYNLYLPLTNALGPAFAYAMIGNGDFENFKPVFFSGVIMGMAAIIMSFFVKENKDVIARQKESVEEKDSDENLMPAIFGFEKGVITPAIVMALMYVGQGAILTFVAMFAFSAGIGSVGRFFIVNAIALFCTRLIFSRNAEKWGYDIPTYAGLLVFAAALFILPCITSLIGLYITAAMFGGALGIVPMTINAMILKRCSSRRSGQAMAAYTSAMDIGVGFGAVILGAILTATNYNIMFGFAGICSLAAIVVYAFTLHGDKKIIEGLS